MKTRDKIDLWAYQHRSIYLDFLRVILGAMLIWKGIEFGRNPKDIQIVSDNGPFDFLSLIMIQYIIMAHFAGGILIMLGLITRLAIVFQVPVLLGAILFIPISHSGPFYMNELTAAFIFLSLVLLLIYGSGRYSLDEFMKNHPNS
jgi:putative oxidoreductase